MRRLVGTFCLALALGLPGLAARSQGPAPAAAVSEWQELIQRDARVRFSDRTRGLAGEVLKAEKSSPERRAAAWFALGGAAALERGPELLEAAQKASEPERSAAILALGELGSGGTQELLELSRSADAALSETALLALLRTRKPALRRGIEEISGDAHDSRREAATKLLVFTADPALSEPTPAARRLLELRWRAAREFGLVDGQTWEVLIYRALCEHADFRADVILRAGARLERPGMRDLLLTALLHGTGEGRLRAAARGIPRELAQLVENGLWKPADPGEWDVLFDELEADRLEAYAPELFEAALGEPALEARALHLLSRSGAQDLAGPIDAALARADAAGRVELCRAMSESEEPAYLQRLGTLAEVREPGVHAAALVAQMLLGSRAADASVRAVLGAPDDPLRPALLAELTAHARSSSVLGLLQDEFPKAAKEERLPLALALAREGVREGRAFCREALASEPPPTPEQARVLVRALRARLNSEDLEVLRALFPREDRPENLSLDVELALALCELNDSEVHPLLHVALWHSDFEVSLFAGALLAQSSGLQALRDEAANPPASVRSTDLRRVGYALGLWGGLPEVESLAQLLRYNSGAPALQGALLGFLSTRTQ